MSDIKERIHNTLKQLREKRKERLKNPPTVTSDRGHVRVGPKNNDGKLNKNFRSSGMMSKLEKVEQDE